MDIQKDIVFLQKPPLLLPFVCLLIVRVGLKTKIGKQVAWNKHCLLYTDNNLVLFNDVIFIVLLTLDIMLCLYILQNSHRSRSVNVLDAFVRR